MRYVGVDFHRKGSYVAIVDEQGQLVNEGWVANNPEAIEQFLGSQRNGQMAAVLEAGRNWAVMHDWLEGMVEEVKLAHPFKVRAIAEAKIKTDKIDARTLAQLLRCDLIPEAHVPSLVARQAKLILRQRIFFVRLRSMVKNRIQVLLDRHPEVRCQWSGTDLFGATGLKWLKAVELPTDARRLLDAQWELLEALTKRVKASDHLVQQLGRGDTRVQLLMTIPGLGKFFALLMVHEVDDIRRFRHPKKLCGYAGLIPSTYASGGIVHHGRITKQGNKYLRWAAIEAVWPAIRKDWSLRTYYEGLKRRRGANVAKVATARRLLTIVWHVLAAQRPYALKDFARRPSYSTGGTCS